MNEWEQVIGGLIQSCAAREEPGDYRKDGLLYCGRCHTPKQCIADFGAPVVVGCTCLCGQERFRAELAAQKQRERMLEIQNLRVQGIQDRAVRNCTFARADFTPNIAKCQRYVERWPEMLESNSGLLFWGDTGGGKTFAAACIANALIDRGVPVLVTSFLKLLNAGWEKAELIQQMKRFSLLVLDDLGAERESAYSLEIVQYVIDERYKTQKPLIITTNLTRQELENAASMDYRRIYDRIMEMCVPVAFGGPSRRKAKAQDKLRLAREVFGASAQAGAGK